MSLCIHYYLLQGEASLGTTRTSICLLGIIKNYLQDVKLVLLQQFCSCHMPPDGSIRHSFQVALPGLTLPGNVIHNLVNNEATNTWCNTSQPILTAQLSSCSQEMRAGCLLRFLWSLLSHSQPRHRTNTFSFSFTKIEKSRKPFPSCYRINH